ncbi:MAG: ubiquinol-cytochrome c reductase iron-sulfur subunit [Candidatus Tectomicrobia bacterium]|nr:ubiquinol-cytochrome c reductase iron-sulfur subunit [Candidatus Tectomicrobia bacterium]
MARAAEALSAEEQGTRRRLLSFLGWSSFASFCGGVSIGSLRFFFPRILYEPAQQFIAGKPEDYQVGEVSTRMKKEQRVWMIRNEQGIYALISVCTHLGCTPIWHSNENRIKCPCHGSNFLVDGQNIAGPAPSPLFRAAVSLDLAGNIVVDKSQKENRPGKRDEPPFVLPLT